MNVVLDVEANGLEKPTKIWVVVCKNIDTNAVSIFRKPTDDPIEKERFLAYAKEVKLWIGHNFLEYDYPCLNTLLGLDIPEVSSNCIDTLLLSRLVNYSREGGHSIEQYGIEFGLEKGKFNDWTKWSQEMEDYCVRDVDICGRIFDSYRSIVSDSNWDSAIHLEQRFQLIVNDLHNNGFAFNTKEAEKLLVKVTADLKLLDDKILEAFPPREILIREFTPKETKFGTISKTSVPRSLHKNIHLYELGKVYQHTHLVPFNPSSHKQLIEVLTEAGWSPEDKTDTHKDTEREVNVLRYKKDTQSQLTLKTLQVRLEQLKKSGWKINETNLGTLPETAPQPARLLAKRILLESRRRTLTEWLSLVQEDGRIRGRFYGIGAWTGRMAHQKPNTANIPGHLKEDGSVKLLGKELRKLWIAPKKRLLVGCDAEGIQLRIFAHYINDPEFTKALVEGRKDDKTDPHSLNQRILGPICKSRQAAKRFIYALLLGGGIGKLSQILGCSLDEGKKALGNLMERYQGFAALKKSIIPADAKRGYFKGLDGRKVPIPGGTQRDREHLCMSGYLQNGEKIIIARAAILVDEKLVDLKDSRKWMFVAIVHDALDSETSNNMDIALRVAKAKDDAIREAGEYYKLRCPMAGSYYNDDTKDYTIGTDWYATH